MNITSKGFHTFTIVLRLTIKEAERLIRDFYNYIKQSDEIEFFPINANKGMEGSDEFSKWLYSSSSRYFVARYTNQGKGILWLLRCSNTSPGFIRPGEIDRPCSIKATINPQILLGKKDYLSASTSEYLNDVEALFDAEAKKISSVLREYRHYLINRPDYCINFDLEELGISCTSEQMIDLIKRGDIPHHYSERTEYSDTSKRRISNKDSFYLESKSVTVNCYRKHKQLKNEFSTCPNLEASHNLIRFEVQCKYLKTYALTKKIKNQLNISSSDVIREMLSDDFCADIIRDYFNRTIRRGDYFTLDGAIQQVRHRRFKKKKEDRLIGELQRINQFRGIHKVRAMLGIEELEVFRRTLNDLADINVNPVTIPKNWGIPHIPNLLDAYDLKVDEERLKKNGRIVS